MLILKLGGAAITDKSQPNTVRPDALQRIAETLAQHPQPMVIVHGAGSFGHILAKEYQLQAGFQADNQKPALVQLQQQLIQLNQAVIAAFQTAGLLALTIHPASMCIMQSGRITDLFLEPVRRVLQMNMLPVLYGDCVWDDDQGFGILSGDQLMIRLADELTADTIAFGTNVDGVLDADGNVIRKIQAQADIASQSSGAAADVTGGMRGKLGEIAQLRNPNTQTWIFNLNDLEALARILSGEGGRGTLITQ